MCLRGRHDHKGLNPCQDTNCDKSALASFANLLLWKQEQEFRTKDCLSLFVSEPKSQRHFEGKKTVNVIPLGVTCSP